MKRPLVLNPPFLYAAPLRGHIFYDHVTQIMTVSDGSRSAHLPIDHDGMIELATALLLAARGHGEGEELVQGAINLSSEEQ